jgi:hypothetical protein
MKLRDKERALLVDIFTKTAEYVASILVLGTVLSKEFNVWVFVSGIIVFSAFILFALFISSKIKDKDG